MNIHQLNLNLQHQIHIFFSQPFTPLHGLITSLRYNYWLLWKRYRQHYFVGHYHDLNMLFDVRNDGSCIGFYDPNHDYEVLALIEMKKKEKHKLFVDVGGNIGSKSLVALKNGYDVIAFEPNPATAAILEINVLLNNFRDHFVLFRTAVADVIGKATFYINPVLMSQSSLYQDVSTANDPHTLKVEVPVKTLDRTLNPEQEITILKIDAEGAELPVLQGAKNLLGKHQIQSVVWEVANDPKAKSVLKTLQLLTDFGFKHYQYNYSTRKLQPYVDGYNCISLLGQ